MRLGRAALLIGASLLPLPALAQSPTPPAAQVQPLQFTERTLPNGLKVYAIRDTSTANVAVQVWYDVGSKDDPRNRSGFAHMFEHLMFKATRNLVPEQLDRLTEDVGGYNNASTADDYTNYFEVVPANHLERLLFAEADRMASLVIDPAVFASERDVVKEELRSRVLAAPYGKLFYVYLPMVSYTHHPYARPGIGSIEDLDAATIEDIRAFHATYYRPDNAVLVVAGKFDPAQLNAWVDEYFAPIDRPDRPIPRVEVAEPKRAEAVRHVVYEPNTPLPAVLVSFQAPPGDHPDAPVFQVLDAILTRGENSRFYEGLVREQIAVEANTFAGENEGPGTYAPFAILASGRTAAEGEAALRREIARLRDEPVTAEELAEAKNELLTSAILGRETAEGKAFALAEGVIINDDPRAADRELAAIQAVTAADIQRVAGTWLRDDATATIHYLPAEAKPADAPTGSITLPASVVTAPLAVPPGITIHTAAPQAERILPPEPGAPVSAAIPTPVEMRLANGLRVITVAKPGVPIVSAMLVSGTGSATDPSGKAGLHQLMAELLTKGTDTRDATEIAAAVESLGGSLSSGAGWDSSAVTLTVKSDQITPALTILADVVRNPSFAAEELDRSRAQAVDGVRVQLADPAALSQLVSQRAVFGGTSYGHPAGGTPDSLPAITRDDIGRAYGESWTPDRTALVLVGDITPEAALTAAQKLFGGWTAEAPPPRVVSVAKVPDSPRVIVVDMPDAGQAGVVIARPGLARRDEDYYPAAVANAVLGVGFSSRLNQEIRIKRGLAYGAGSSLDARRNTGPVTARTQTKNESAAEVVALIRAEMERLGREAPPAAELDTRKAVLIGGFGRAVETSSGIAEVLSDYVTDRVPLDELQRYVGRVEGVSPQAAQAAAAEYLAPDEASIVVVGNASLFADELRKTYPNLEVIAADALDLDNPTLE